MNKFDKHRTVSVAAAGRMYGKFTPSLLGFIEEEKGGKVVRIPMNRKERRRHGK